MSELYDATVALLDKLDVVEKAISGIFVLAHVHGISYTGPNYKEEYDRCREWTGTKRKEELDESPPIGPHSPAMFWFLDEKNQEHLKEWSGKYVAVIKKHGVIGVVSVHENFNELQKEFHEEFGENASVYFGYVHLETITTVASTVDDGEEI